MTAQNRRSLTKITTNGFRKVFNLYPTKNSPTKWNAMLLGFVFLYGCAGTVSLADLQPGSPGGRTFSVEGKMYEEIWSAALASMKVEMNVVEQHKSSGVIKARAHSNKVVAFFISPTTPNAYRYEIKVLSKSYMQTDFIDRDWEPSVIEDFKLNLYSNHKPKK